MRREFLIKCIVLTPFTHNSNIGWIPKHIQGNELEFKVIPAGYHHDRSRVSSSFEQWFDFIKHALRAWFSIGIGENKANGFITCFPQLPLILGCLKRLTFSKRFILAWTFNLGRTYGGVKGKIAKFGFKAVDKFIVHSRDEIEIYSNWLNIPASRFEFVPLAVQADSIDDVLVEHQRKSAEGIEPYVLSLGTANRDYSSLVKAIKKTGYKTIIVAGQSAVSDIQLPANVELMSGLSLKECHKLALKAVVNVVPIKDKDAPSGQVTFIEGMMLGRAMIVSNCSGSKDYIESGRDGLLVEVGSASDLEKAIKQFWENKELRVDMGKKAKAKALQCYRFESVAPTMRRFIFELANEKA